MLRQVVHVATLETTGARCNLLAVYISAVVSHLLQARLSYKTSPTHRLTPALVIGKGLFDLHASSTRLQREYRRSVSCSCTIQGPKALLTKVTTVVNTLYDLDRRENLNFEN